MKFKSLFCIAIFPLLCLMGCNTTPKEHSHSYNAENIEWKWTETSTGGYKAKAILSCESCEESVEGHFLEIDATVTDKETKAPTCLAAGTITYTATINYEGKDYSATKEKSIVNQNAHHYIELQADAYLKSAATCTEDAVYYKSCEHCHEKSEETFTVVNSRLGHDLVYHAETSSTCQVHGNIEHYKCNRCHKYFSDAAATTELNESDVILPFAHNMILHAGTAATCTEAGTRDYYTCTHESQDIKYKNIEGTETFNNDSELVIEKLGHEFNESLNCVRGDKTLKQEYEMADVAALDTIAPITISDFGLASELDIPRDGSHIFAPYDYPTNKGIDLWLRFKYTVKANDNYFFFYLFNNGDENGMICRLQMNRTEDDGRIRAYIYTQNDYSANPGTTAVHGAGVVGTNFWFPYPCGVKSSTTNIAHITAYCLNEETNLYRCTFTIGVEGGTQYYPVPTASDVPGSKADNETTNPEFHFDICLGANYFNDNAGKKFRVTCTSNADPLTFYDHASEEKVVVYKDAAGNVAGKLNDPGTAKIPQLVSTGKTFIGWFDTKGNRVNDGDTVSTKYILTPRFVDTQANMFVPSDTLGNEFAAAKTGWFESSSFEGECGGQLPVNEISDRYDFYYIYHFVSRSNDDNYAIFGLPFDFVEGSTRLHLRIDNPKNNNLVGYIYGAATSLGDAGAAGTNFSQAGFRANRSDLLIHMTISNAPANDLTLNVEIVNLGDGQVYQTSRNVTFNTAGSYAINNPVRNVFDCIKHACEYRITDAF